MQRPERYHHGNLRPALLAAAEELLVEGGIEALSWRAIARRAGVSPGAPYHHFADKAALLTALAQQHLAELDRRFQAACAEYADPHEQLRALGMVYVDYALDHPAAFRLMFRPEIGSPFGSAPAATPVFGVLLQVVRACRADNAGDPADTERVAFAAWGLVHGLAALLLDGPLAALADDRERVHALVLTSTAHFAVDSVTPVNSQPYVVLVDDNFHSMDASARYQHGAYSTCEAAVQACKQIVIESLKHCHRAGMTADELYQTYVMHGDDPFIVSDDKTCAFSAWDFARSYAPSLVAALAKEAL
jgi:AcrR family transcriptional regulator